MGNWEHVRPEEARARDHEARAYPVSLHRRLRAHLIVLGNPCSALLLPGANDPASQGGI